MTALDAPRAGCLAFPRSSADPFFGASLVLRVEGDIVWLQNGDGTQLLAPVSEYRYQTPLDPHSDDLETSVRREVKRTLVDAYSRLTLYVIVGSLVGVGAAMALFSYFGGAS